MRLEKVVTEEDVESAYGVFSALKEAFDRVSVKPELSEQLMVELIQKMPEFFDALMTVTVPEHRPIVAGVVKSAMGLVRSWRRAMTGAR